ncbi:cytochrome P450, partial [Streptomyces sp. OF3]
MSSGVLVGGGPAGGSPADPGFWALPARARAEVFARLREREGLAFVPERGGGWYAVVRHADVMVASRRPDLFLSGPGVTTPPPARWVRWVFGDSMVNLDDPRHAVLRRIVSRSFTPRLLERVERDMVEIAARIVTAVERDRPVDFVSAVAAPMPFEVICSMMGVPRVQRERVMALVAAASEHTGVRRGVAARLRSPARGLRALAEMRRIIVALGRERRRRPGEDLVSALVSAEVDGRSLTGRELGAFFSLLLVAGVETTRNALAHGLWLLTAHPAQRERLCADLAGGLPGAVEEIVRFSSPIVQFRRTVAADCELGGQRLRAGDRVALFYESANRDPRVFEAPEVFD